MKTKSYIIIGKSVFAELNKMDIKRLALIYEGFGDKMRHIHFLKIETLHLNTPYQYH